MHPIVPSRPVRIRDRTDRWHNALRAAARTVAAAAAQRARTAAIRSAANARAANAAAAAAFAAAYDSYIAGSCICELAGLSAADASSRCTDCSKDISQADRTRSESANVARIAGRATASKTHHARSE